MAFALKHSQTYLGGRNEFGWSFASLVEVLAGNAELLSFDTEAEALAEAQLIARTYASEYRDGWLAEVEAVPMAGLILPPLPPAVTLALAEMAQPPQTAHRKTLDLYIVRTDAEHPEHHGLHTNTAPFVITTSPTAGDHIAYKLSGYVGGLYDVRRDGSWVQVSGHAQLDLESRQLGRRGYVRLQGTSHPGRAAMLGEDDLDAAYGENILAKLWLEKLQGAEWQYAPIEIQEIPEDDLGNHPLDLTAHWHPETGWQLASENLSTHADATAEHSGTVLETFRVVQKKRDALYRRLADA